MLPRTSGLKTSTCRHCGEQQLLVRVAYGGICGSDLHYQQHGGFGTVRIKQPLALGHEVSGIIDVGWRQSQWFSPGSTYCHFPVQALWAAAGFANLGMHNQCLSMRFYGSAMPFPTSRAPFARTW
jgi:L-idonate 5-dehydrogenase